MPKKIKRGINQKQRQNVRVSQKVNVVVQIPKKRVRRTTQKVIASDTRFPGFSHSGTQTFFVERSTTPIVSNPYYQPIAVKEELNKTVGGGLLTNSEALKNISNISVGALPEPKRLELPSSVNSGFDTPRADIKPLPFPKLTLPLPTSLDTPRIRQPTQASVAKRNAKREYQDKFGKPAPKSYSTARILAELEK